MPVLIVGCGDTGRRVAVRYLERGQAVTGLVRSPDSAAALTAAGIEPLVADLDRPLPSLPQAETVIYAAPPPRAGDDDPRLARVLDALARDCRLVYISTSGVYGDCGGDWVDERRALDPQTDRARRRAAAERRLRSWGGEAMILRAPGIYGPGRLPLARLRAGEAVLRDADSPWTNRIHVEDLASAVLAAADRGRAGRVYNAADGNPTRMAAHYRALAEYLDLPPPPVIDWATASRRWSPMRLSFLRESRRLCNRRLGEELGVRLRYPAVVDALRDGAA